MLRSRMANTQNFIALIAVRFQRSNFNGLEFQLPDPPCHDIPHDAVTSRQGILFRTLALAVSRSRKNLVFDGARLGLLILIKMLYLGLERDRYAEKPAAEEDTTIASVINENFSWRPC